MKQLGRNWFGVAASAALLAMAHALPLAAAVRSDFDARANFGEYRTFAWGDAAGNGGGDSLVNARIRANASGQLAARGMREDGASPDVLLSFHAASGTERTRTVVPSGFGYRPMFYGRPLYRPGFRPYRGPGFGRRPFGYDPFSGMSGYGYGGGMRVIESEFAAGRIEMEMTDARTNQVVWRAAVTTSGDSAFDVESEKSIARAMKDAFKKFPRKR